MVRTLSYVVMGVVLAVALAFGVTGQTNPGTIEDRTEALASTIRCPQCRSQSAADSDVASARAVRAEIADRLEAGQSDDEIRTYFASRYGDDILLTPPATGVGSLVWIIPVVATAAGAVGLGFAFVRWRRWAR